MADPAPVPLVALLTDVEDPRCPQARRHSLEAVICGVDNGTEVEFFGHQKQAWRETFRARPHGMPWHDPFGRVFGLLDPAPLEACFAAWVQSLAATLPDEARRVLGPQRVDDRSNELTALPALLETLALEGGIVTLDAMGCQKRIAQTPRPGAD